MTILKAASELHQRENLEASTVALGPDDRAALDAAFPPPRRKSPLAMI